MLALLFIYFLFFIFLNESMLNESRISVFSPTEANHVPMAKQTRCHSQDSRLLLIIDY